MGRRLFVGNLAYHTGEEELRVAFGADGREVHEVVVKLDRSSGRSRGFGFVTLASEAEAAAAIVALDGAQLDGRRLRVNEARELPQRAGEREGREGREAKEVAGLGDALTAQDAPLADDREPSEPSE